MMAKDVEVYDGIGHVVWTEKTRDSYRILVGKYVGRRK
jgi:hypothetical protein